MNDEVVALPFARSSSIEMTTRYVTIRKWSDSLEEQVEHPATLETSQREESQVRHPSVPRHSSRGESAELFREIRSMSRQGRRISF